MLSRIINCNRMTCLLTVLINHTNSSPLIQLRLRLLIFLRLLLMVHLLLTRHRLKQSRICNYYDWLELFSVIMSCDWRKYVLAFVYFGQEKLNPLIRPKDSISSILENPLPKYMFVVKIAKIQWKSNYSGILIILIL